VTYRIYKNLGWLNGLSAAEAEDAFLGCCGSREWAARMTNSRPFAMLEDLFKRAGDVWFSLPVAERLEAFASHSKLGNRRSSGPLHNEPPDVASGNAEVRRKLAEVSRLYEEKFGFMLIVCAGERPAEEILAIARARLGNSVETELHLAAEEQAKIIDLRLTKLLEK
jgi:2-oxo-4-hydroxy-4-carboxy-5-ureidoimidazoline decarboxylase